MDTYRKIARQISYEEKPGDNEPMVDLAVSYENSGADVLFFHDWSKTDAGHEDAMRILKKICQATDVPVIAGGRTLLLEDVKRYFYAGASKVWLYSFDNSNLIGGIDSSKDRKGMASDKPTGSGQAKRKKHSDDGGAKGPDGDHIKGRSKLNLQGIDKWQWNLYLESTERFGKDKILIFASTEGSVSDIDSFVQIGGGESDGFIVSDTEVFDEAIMKSSESSIIIDREGTINIRKLKRKWKDAGHNVKTLESPVAWGDLKLGPDGLVPVVVQDYRTDEVLMLAYMNQKAFEQTLRIERMTYYSRSRQALWVKGETSGHFQYLRSLEIDCDNDTLLAKVKQVGPACHTGEHSCFYRNLAKKDYRDHNASHVLTDVYGVITDRKEHPREGSYTNYLFDKGIDKILKKLGEEATEIVIASKNPDNGEVVYETADFLYHLMVLMAQRGITWEDVLMELKTRE
ncbi:MAG: bifunctional phosphoribosyl-AMP cyclohydrolase/phosphoribosyl-ATP diphosphatase HisIE [Lachnospiraceae bacterium]|jgi:phosphoribosyl-ATP pyrophosphohydrolase/phosphoribosyl-AMP cyclohydrolase|nr:bifunctional phosphoribosyl-AMP cyclohydrolase/phosphoribosyl-ATP diphosphatase HisIE [Lachnospiraceae bacterium]